MFFRFAGYTTKIRQLRGLAYYVVFMEGTRNISARICIALLCGFWGYIFMAVLPATNLSLYLTEISSAAGKIWLGISALQFAAIPLVYLKNEKIKWVELALNVIPILPIIYYIYMIAPRGVS